MRTSKKLRTVLVTVLALASLSGTVLAVAASGGWNPASWNASKHAAIKYESPNIGEVALEGVAPDPMTPAEDAISTDKPWYEYITYSVEPLGTFEADGKLIKYYDPYD